MLLAVNGALARGQLAEAEALAGSAVDRARRDGNAYLSARSAVVLAALVGLRGDVTQMLELGERAVGEAPPELWHNTVSDAYARSLQGYGALLQSRPADCLRWTTAVDEISAAFPDAPRAEISTIIPVLGVLRAAARFDLGEHRAALEAMRCARVGVPAGRALDRPVLAFVALLEHGAAVALGLRAHAHAVAVWAQERVGLTGDVLFMQATGPAAIGRLETAAERLQPVLDGTTAPAIPWTVIEAWLLDCTIALRAGHRPRAEHSLQQALQRSAAMGIRRPLVAAPAAVAELMAERLGHLGAMEPLAREVLDLRGARGHNLPATPLTDRERAVLDMLPTFLSLEEIAGELSVSLNTVRSHVRALHDKLGVNSRTGAVAAAQREGLIVTEPPVLDR